MPELRQNLATKEWVVISSERAVAPQSLRVDIPRPAAKDPKCPLCAPGGKELYSLGEPWKVRVIESPAPALVSGAGRIETKNGLYRRLPGEGTHEVIVESPDHGQDLTSLEHEKVEDVIAVYQERFRAASENLKVSLALLFRNHGAAADNAHPHSQLVGSSVVPAHIRHRMDEAQKYYEQNKECVVCRMVEEESSQKERLVVDTKYFSAFVLFAALSPFHIWIVPKRHTPAFHELSSAEADDLATVLQAVLRRIDKGLGNPDYSFVIQSTPQDRGTTEAFHWYLSLVVRVGRVAGFELGSGMHINNVLPEDSARFLKSVAV